MDQSRSKQSQAPFAIPSREAFADLYKDSGVDKQGNPTKRRPRWSFFNRTLGILLKEKEIAKYLVPIIPDETRTFGMEGLFRRLVSTLTASFMNRSIVNNTCIIEESKDGQVLQEGINEAGSMASFVAAGNGIRQPWHADGSFLYLLFDVRLPARWRLGLAGG